jgi:hypothetical protein
MQVLTLIVLLLPMLAGAHFNFATDGLCFRNGTEELREFGPLGRLGDEKGVCQGMSGIVSGFHEQANFQAASARLTESETFHALEDIVRRHSAGCSREKIVIRGYSNLQELCRDHKRIFLSKSIAYNADIAIKEIAPLYLEFQSFKAKPVNTSSGRKKIHRAIEAIRKKLALGRWPLMLYFSHVVSVVALKDEFTHGKLSKVTMEIYDSNYQASLKYEIPYDLDDLPAMGQKMIWEITPERKLVPCE